jgi:hypothetical protein
MEIEVFRCRIVGEPRRGRGSAAVRWAGPADLKRLPLATAHRRAVEAFAS